MTNFSSSRQRLDDSRGLIVLKGEVDIYTAPRFKEDLLALIDEGVTDILVDLMQVEFIDSTALGVLIGGVKRLHPLERAPAADRRAAAGPQDPRHHGARPGLLHLPRPREGAGGSLTAGLASLGPARVDAVAGRRAYPPRLACSGAYVHDLRAPLLVTASDRGGITRQRSIGGRRDVGPSIDEGIGHPA